MTSTEQARVSSSQIQAFQSISPLSPVHNTLPEPPDLDRSTSFTTTDASSSKLNTATVNLIDGNLRATGTGGGRFLREAHTLPADNVRSNSQSPFRLTMPAISPGQLTFSAMQYLPVPILVLNSLKTVVLANEAMGRMLGIGSDESNGEDLSTTIDQLRGQTLSQVGIDMLQDGHPVWITWETFLDTLVTEVGVRPSTTGQWRTSSCGGDATPTIGTLPNLDGAVSSVGQSTRDAIVEVVISRKDITKTAFDSRYKTKESEYQAFAKMIITIWEIEDKQTYFTLTFTNTGSNTSIPTNPRKAMARSGTLDAIDRKSIAHSNPPSVASSRDSSSPSFYSPGMITMSSSPFPPMGPPSVASHSHGSTPSMLQKIIRMKDALLDNTKMPIIAMWKDGTVIFPNKAARELLPRDVNLDSSSDGHDLLANWKVWTEDFSRQLDISEHPLSILIRTETPFASIRVGMYDAEDRKIVFDMLGEAICDDTTHEFLAGVITCCDVTVMTEEITQIKERDEERFRVICDTMPQLVWTATPDGGHDFFNTRWYNYTGLEPEQCLGFAWQSPFHPDDLPEALTRWKHSLKTGNPYMMEYRCRSKEGEWRWFLGRALAVRNKETGTIEKWLGM